MSVSEKSISEAAPSQEQEISDLVLYADEIEYFETHDLSEELANLPEVHFEISPQARRKRYPLDANLAAQLDSIASQRGTSAESLLNEWVREKMAEVEVASLAK